MALIIQTTQERRENVDTAAHQSASAVLGFDDGGYVIVWGNAAYNGVSFTGTTVRGIRYQADGSTVGETLISENTFLRRDSTPSISGLANGGLVVSWLEDLGASTNVVKARSFDVDGSANAVVNVATGGALQSGVSVAGLTSPGFVVVWRDAATPGGGNGGGSIMRARYGDGDMLGYPPQFVTTAGATLPSDPVVVGLNDGESVALWASGGEIKGQRFTAFFAMPTGTEFTANTNNTGDQSKPAAAALAGGGFVAVWQSASINDVGYDIRGQRFDTDGARVGVEFRVNATTASNQQDPAVATLSDGSFVVVWVSDEQDGSGKGIYAQRFAANGTKVGTEILVNVTTSGDQVDPAVAALDNGRFIVTWSSPDGISYISSPNNGIFSRIFDAPAAFGGILDGTVQIVQGDGTNEIFRAAPGSLGPGDQIDGGGGHDRLDLSATGTLDISAPSVFTGIEELRGTSGTDTFIVSAARLAGITSFVANGGSDIFLARDSVTLPAGWFVAELSAINPLASTAMSLTGNDRAQRIVGNAGRNTLSGGGGNDTLVSGGGGDLMLGGTGDDIFFVSSNTDRVRENVGEGYDRVFTTSSFTLFSSAEIESLAAADLAATTPIALRGNHFTQVIIGNAGNNILEGLGGADTLRGGLGADTLTGGAGADRFDFNSVAEIGMALNQRDVITDFQQGQDLIDVNDIDANSLLAGKQAFTWLGTAGHTGAGATLRYQHAGGNTLVYGDVDANGSGDFTLQLNGLHNLTAADFTALSINAIQGTNGNDVLTGAPGGKVMLGLNGNDTITGGAGADTIWGGAGADSMTGGAGADVFKWASHTHSGNAVGTRDIVTDFQQGVDRIDLSGIDANINVAGNQAFTWLGTAAHTGAGATLRYLQSGGNTLVYGDVDGDKAADFTLQLTGLYTLTAADFVL